MSHERLRCGVAVLAGDTELLRPRRTNWGELKEARWLFILLLDIPSTNSLESCCRTMTRGNVGTASTILNLNVTREHS
jgi:hypothetical protein